MSDIEMASKAAEDAPATTEVTTEDVSVEEVDEAIVLAVMAAVKKEQEAEAAAAAAAAAEAAAKKEAEEEAAAKAFSGLQVYDTIGEYDLEAKIPKEDYGYGTGKVGSCEVRCGSCGPDGKGLCRPIVFNPWSTLIGFGTLLGFALWCILDPVNSKTTLGNWQSWCTKYFSWCESFASAPLFAVV